MCGYWGLICYAVYDGDAEEEERDWQEMVLGSFAKCSRRTAVLWWFSALLSTAGWIMAFLGVAETLSRYSSDDAAGQLYMFLCLLQLMILIFWTMTLWRVNTDSPQWWRYVNISLLALVTLVYFASAFVFLHVPLYHMSIGYRNVAAVLLVVHALHGCLWNAAWWGRSYVGHSHLSTP